MSSPSDTYNCSSSSSDDKEVAAEISSNKKVSTSCEQKVETSCNDDGRYNTSSNSSSVDAVSDSLCRVDISNDGDDKMSISDEKLFQDPPPKEECPICLLPIPHALSGCGVNMVYQACCGKFLCEGCSMAEDNEMREGNLKQWCALCRVPLPKDNKEMLKRFHKRLNMNDANAFCQLGCKHRTGGDFPQDLNKANELLHKAVELGSCNANYELALMYLKGEGVERDAEKTIHHWKLAAIGGHEGARYNLGVFEYNVGNMERSYKHYMIAARGGFDMSLKKVGEGYKDGYVTKDEYANTLRAYQCSVDEMKSKQRDIAAAQR